MKKRFYVLGVLFFLTASVSYSSNCHASLECGGNQTMGCTGDNSCSASESDKSVTCDGVTTQCPNMEPPGTGGATISPN